ncbi:hypothetical protein [Shewanella youngdeokensis]|uniref:Uncharacterized protein n=1 Tax=Shewanella youngdeokensis TaxID=2999068 RepID=A0ABZ0K0H9_9GAMM|nr:hypothetical protein RGE70_04420 [Shewanella sp. DAU334]
MKKIKLVSVVMCASGLLALSSFAHAGSKALEGEPDWEAKIVKPDSPEPLGKKLLELLLKKTNGSEPKKDK